MSTMRSLFACILALAWLSAFSQSSSPRTFAFRTPSVACGEDPSRGDLLPLDGYGQVFAPPAQPGAGVMPSAFGITQVCITHYVNGDTRDAYAVVGKSGGNGDWMTPMLPGAGLTCFPFNPPNQFVPGEYLDVHANCAAGTHWVSIMVQYVNGSSIASAIAEAPINVKYLYRGQWVVVLSGSRSTNASGGVTVRVRLPNGLVETANIADLQ